MKRFVLLVWAVVVSLCAGASSPHAQETVAAQPALGHAGEASAAYERKIQDLNRIIKIMEEQLATCNHKPADTQPSSPAVETRKVHITTETMRGNEGFVSAMPATADEAQGAAEVTETVPAYVPPVAPTRYGGGFRMAPEQRLTCDDYSEAYFNRHPTMARVCGRDETPKTDVVPMVLPLSASAVVSGALLPRP